MSNLFWFLKHDARPPAENMAWDEALSQAVRRGYLAGFLRFYRWAPATLSFGYFQKPARLLLPEAYGRADLGLVRRATGGKMVFHDREWTFSCAMPTDKLAQRQTSMHEAGFLAWFRSLVEPIAEALRRQGFPVAFADVAQTRGERSREIPDRVILTNPEAATSTQPVNPCSSSAVPDSATKKNPGRDRIHCFTAAAGHSLMVGDRKLIGAAGVVRGGVLMVHGSIPIAPSRDLPPVFITTVDPDAQRETAYLGTLLSQNLVDELPMRVAEVMRETHELEPAAEQSLIAVKARVEALVRVLAQKKYARLEWPTEPAEEWDRLAEDAFSNL